MPTVIRESVNTIIPGAWNCAIISPQWLRTKFPKLFPDEEVNVEISGSPGSTVCRYNYKKFQIEPAQNRIALWPLDMSPEVLDVVSKVAWSICSKLEHTPIFAVGHNINFSMDAGERFIPVDFVDEGRLAAFCEEQGLFNRLNQYKFSFSFEDHNLNVSYEEQAEKRTLALNFHYDARTREKIDIAISRFRSNYERAIELSKTLIRRDGSND